MTATFLPKLARMDVRPIHLEHAAAGHANGWIGAFVPSPNP